MANRTTPLAMVMLQRRVLGVLLVGLLATGGWFTYAVFTKVFIDAVPVTMQASRIGLQLPDAADVKVRGLIVGEVRSVSAEGSGASVQLALDPELADGIPADVTALIVPKTLFGEKYVALQVPAGATVGGAGPDNPLQAGDVIEKGSVPIEVEKVLADIYPLLRTVPPEDLSMTLNALATALEGRGDRLGDNLERLNGYLQKFNPKVPALVGDLDRLGQVSDVYASVTPELGRLLRNQVVTGQTVVAKEQQIHDLFVDVAGFASTTRDFLQQTGDDIVRLGEVSVPVTAALAEYSPIYPCLSRGMLNWIPHMSQAYRDYKLHINLELLPNQPTGYTPADDPRYDPEGIGPSCATLPNPPYSQYGTPAPPLPPERVESTGTEGYHKNRVAPVFDPTSGFAGTAAERELLSAVAGPVLGVAPREVPGLTTLLLGPLARGTEVSVR